MTVSLWEEGSLDSETRHMGDLGMLLLELEDPEDPAAARTWERQEGPCPHLDFGAVGEALPLSQRPGGTCPGPFLGWAPGDRNPTPPTLLRGTSRHFQATALSSEAPAPAPFQGKHSSELPGILPSSQTLRRPSPSPTLDK